MNKIKEFENSISGFLKEIVTNMKAGRMEEASSSLCYLDGFIANTAMKMNSIKSVLNNAQARLENKNPHYPYKCFSDVNNEHQVHIFYDADVNRCAVLLKITSNPKFSKSYDFEGTRASSMYASKNFQDAMQTLRALKSKKNPSKKKFLYEVTV